jgi:acyl transferase domain-containing protein
MDVQKIGLLFPGQGACYPGVLEDAAGVFPQVAAVFDEIDAVAKKRMGRAVSDVLWSRKPKTLETLLAEDPDIVQLSIFGTSVAVYRVLDAHGLRPDSLIGHSFGEIAALVCAGAFTTTEGAEIVCDRVEATRFVKADGYMAVVATDAATAGALVNLVGDADTVVAGVNSDTQTVISGKRASMDLAAALAKVLDIPFVPLNSPLPFHSPLMEPVKAEFARRLSRFSARPLTVPVYSPIAGRYYQADDNVTEWLSLHLVKPVRFADAMRDLYADGLRTVVECGALDALTKLSKKALRTSDLAAVSCLTRTGSDVASLRSALTTLGVSAAAVSEADRLRLAILAPAAFDESDAEEFWAACEAAVRGFVDDEYARFRRERQVAPNAAPAIPVAREVAVPAAEVGRERVDRAEVFKDLVAIYAAALEYPEEVFTETVELEGELGIDSVKQTELLGRVSEIYALPARPSDFRLSNYNTMGKVVDFVVEYRAAGPSAVAGAPASAPAPAPAHAEAPAPAVSAAVTLTRAELLRNIVVMYAAALEYPEEVFTPDVELESELGVDSVKQTELLGRLSAEYGLPPRPADFRLANYNTLRKVTDFVFAALTEPAATAAGNGQAGAHVPVLVASARPSSLAIQ